MASLARLVFVVAALAVFGGRQVASSPYHCGEVDFAKLQPFCSEVPPPFVCMDATDFANIYLRTNVTFATQEDECSTTLKAHKICPNDPQACKPLNKTQYCGGANQACNKTTSSDVQDAKKECLPICWTDCYPCNSMADCELLVSFGVLGAEGASCHFQA